MVPFDSSQITTVGTIAMCFIKTKSNILKIILSSLFLSMSTLSAYELATDQGSIYILPTHDIGQHWIKPAEDRSDDLLLIKSLRRIFESFKNNDVKAFMDNHINLEDFDGLDVDQRLIPKTIKKRARNEQAFQEIIRTLKEKNIDLSNATFAGIKREEISKTKNLTAIRKVYLMFKVDNKEYSLYLRTLIKNKSDTWKMTKKVYFQKPDE